MCLYIKLSLLPKNFNYTKVFKVRRHSPYFLPKLSKGLVGFLVNSNVLLSSSLLFRFVLFLKRIVRKSDKLQRRFWLPLAVSVPVTRKPKGSRMGKGKGSLTFWSAKVVRGSPIVELAGARLGRISKYTTQLSVRIPGGVTPFFALTRGGSGARGFTGICASPHKASKWRGLRFNCPQRQFAKKSSKLTQTFIRTRVFRTATGLVR